MPAPRKPETLCPCPSHLLWSPETAPAAPQQLQLPAQPQHSPAYRLGSMSCPLHHLCPRLTRRHPATAPPPPPRYSRVTALRKPCTARHSRAADSASCSLLWRHTLPGLNHRHTPSCCLQAAAEPEVEECSICMEADIEVRVASCHHGMCIECARAVCSMRVRPELTCQPSFACKTWHHSELRVWHELQWLPQAPCSTLRTELAGLQERAPQCPYCRCLITDMEPVPIVRAS